MGFITQAAFEGVDVTTRTQQAALWTSASKFKNSSQIGA
jgi:hypothetical protein